MCIRDRILIDAKSLLGVIGIGTNNDFKVCYRGDDQAFDNVVDKFTVCLLYTSIGQDVMNGLNPGQMVIKIVNEEMIKLKIGRAHV